MLSRNECTVQEQLRLVLRVREACLHKLFCATWSVTARSPRSAATNFMGGGREKRYWKILLFRGIISRLGLPLFKFHNTHKDTRTSYIFNIIPFPTISSRPPPWWSRCRKLVSGNLWKENMAAGAEPNILQVEVIKKKTIKKMMVQ